MKMEFLAFSAHMVNHLSTYLEVFFVSVHPQYKNNQTETSTFIIVMLT